MLLQDYHGVGSLRDLFYRRVPENDGGKSAFQFVKIAKEHIQTCTKQKMSN